MRELTIPNVVAWLGACLLYRRAMARLLFSERASFVRNLELGVGVRIESAVYLMRPRHVRRAFRRAIALRDNDAAPVVPDRMVYSYPTLFEMGLAVGDRVVWERCVMVMRESGGFAEEDHYHVGVISADLSHIPTPHGERFVDIKTDDGKILGVSTLYLRRVAHG